METEVSINVKQRNETITTIYNRRAVRKYRKKPVSKKLIEELIAAGRMAPSAMNKQPWKFYVVTNEKLIDTFSSDIAKTAFKETVKKGLKGILKTLSAMLHFAQSFTFSSIKDPVFYNAPVVIFITSPKTNEWAGLDIGMCAQNIMLAAKSLGLDTCPVGFGKFVEHTNHYSLLNIPSNEQVQLSIIVGYGDEEPSVHERRTDNIKFFD
ncbi:MAG TPA: nitroreductase [Parafilimonas sp.]|nr:nitroreductase [Parafilimonas sp.]